jgi:hypothetical protein
MPYTVPGLRAAVPDKEKRSRGGRRSGRLGEPLGPRVGWTRFQSAIWVRIRAAARRCAARVQRHSKAFDARGSDCSWTVTAVYGKASSLVEIPGTASVSPTWGILSGSTDLTFGEGGRIAPPFTDAQVTMTLAIRFLPNPGRKVISMVPADRPTQASARRSIFHFPTPKQSSPTRRPD